MGSTETGLHTSETVSGQGHPLQWVWQRCPIIVAPNSGSSPRTRGADRIQANAPCVLARAAVNSPGLTVPPNSNDAASDVRILLMQGYTLREAAQALGVSVITVRRYIRSGKLKARLVPSKFGDSYIIEDLPLPIKRSSEDTQPSQPLINRIEQLSQEVGYWKAKAEMLQERLLLLEPPRQTPKRSWWQRLFRGQQQATKNVS